MMVGLVLQESWTLVELSCSRQMELSALSSRPPTPAFSAASLRRRMLSTKMMMMMTTVK